MLTYYIATAPKITGSNLSAENATRIYDKNGDIIWSMATHNREYAKADDIPDSLKQAVVSIEDRRFYKHHGVDPIRIGGALVSNLTGSSLGMQGGSTLTQQLVKLSVFSTSSADQTLKRKTQEMWLATQVEKNYSKDQILEFYINKVYMGHGIYGMKTASEYYFNKPLKDLTLAQQALLAGIPQSPTNYDPYAKDTESATNRRNLVLQAMVRYGAISQQDADDAEKQAVDAGLQDIDSKAEETNEKRLMVDGYVTSVLSQAKSMGYDTSRGGLQIYTNMDYKLQKKLYDEANNSSNVSFPSKDVQIGATMTNPNTGAVVAQLGGRNLKSTFGINRATQTMRSGGSSVKPLVDYGPAIEYLNWPTFRTVQDKKYKYPGTDISVNDWDKDFMGNITMRSAIVLSRNIPAIKALDAVGPKKAGQFLKNLGITTTTSPEGASALGIPISSEQEAAAFGALSNGGTYYEPNYVNKIVTGDGTSHYNKNNGKRAMKESTAFMLTDMLKGVVGYAGTAADAAIDGIHQAGKSGLVAYDERAGMPDQAISDAWFTGYTRSYVLSVWTGYDQPNQPNHYISWEDQDLPAKYYKQVMSYAMKYRKNSDWEKPDSVSSTTRNKIIEYKVKDADWSNGGLPSVYSIPGSGEQEGGSDVSAYSNDSSSTSSEVTTSSSRRDEEQSSSSSSSVDGAGNAGGGNGNGNNGNNNNNNSNSGINNGNNSNGHSNLNPKTVNDLFN
ncbi:PBP1A family penicillin-binding protein [Eupransor demetentiae]